MSVAITIRHVPEPVRDELAARAAQAGKSLQEFLLGELSAAVSRPTVDEVIARARKRAEGSRIGIDDIVAARDADRR
jgi:plasmid stability protein